MIEQPAIVSSLFVVGRELIFYVTMLFFLLYTLALAYHWFSYGTQRKTVLLSLAIFLIVSSPLLLVMSLTI